MFGKNVTLTKFKKNLMLLHELNSPQKEQFYKSKPLRLTKPPPPKLESVERMPLAVRRSSALRRARRRTTRMTSSRTS